MDIRPLCVLTQGHGLVHVAPRGAWRRALLASSDVAAVTRKRPRRPDPKRHRGTRTSPAPAPAPAGTGGLPAAGSPDVDVGTPCAEDTFDTVASPERLNLARYAVRVHHVPAQRADAERQKCGNRRRVWCTVSRRNALDRLALVFGSPAGRRRGRWS